MIPVSVMRSSIRSSVVAAATVHNGHGVVAINGTIVTIVRNDHTAFVNRASAGAVTATIGVTGAASAMTGFCFLREGDERDQDGGECD